MINRSFYTLLSFHDSLCLDLKLKRRIFFQRIKMILIIFAGLIYIRLFFDFVLVLLQGCKMIFLQ